MHTAPKKLSILRAQIVKLSLYKNIKKCLLLFIACLQRDAYTCFVTKS